MYCFEDSYKIDLKYYFILELSYMCICTEALCRCDIKKMHKEITLNLGLVFQLIFIIM